MIKPMKLIVKYAILYTRFSFNKKKIYNTKSLTPVVVSNS